MASSFRFGSWLANEPAREGDTAQALAQRRAKTSPLRDVAGLLRSLDYAAATVRLSGREGAKATVAALEARRQKLLNHFYERASEVFASAYRNVVHPANATQWTPSEAALLDLFLIEKASYEVDYEAANRPDWIGLPVRGLTALVRKLLHEEWQAQDTSTPARVPGEPDLEARSDGY